MFQIPSWMSKSSGRTEPPKAPTSSYESQVNESNEFQRGFGSSNDPQRCWVAYLDNSGVITYAFRCYGCGEFPLEAKSPQSHYHPCYRAGDEFFEEIVLLDFPARIGKVKKKK